MNWAQRSKKNAKPEQEVDRAVKIDEPLRSFNNVDSLTHLQ